MQNFSEAQRVRRQMAMKICIVDEVGDSGDEGKFVQERHFPGRVNDNMLEPEPQLYLSDTC